MDTCIAKVELTALATYLLQRAKLRFLSSRESSVDVDIYRHGVTLDLRDLEQKYFAADCVREPENLLIYLALAQSGLADCFVDVGANCGHVAASVVDAYRSLVLFEPNPRLAALLRTIFADRPHVSIRECAVVGEASRGSIALTVPVDSSGLATLGGTELSALRERANIFEVRAETLENETRDLVLARAYIKIDVEGFEYQVIESARDLIVRERPIVGFEALSKSAAEKCAGLFVDYVYYCARFDFLEPGGALTRSISRLFGAALFGGAVDILRLSDIGATTLQNFSQIFSVPREKADIFETAIASFVANNPSIDASRLKTWTMA